MHVVLIDLYMWYIHVHCTCVCIYVYMHLLMCECAIELLVINCLLGAYLRNPNSGSYTVNGSTRPRLV